MDDGQPSFVSIFFEWVVLYGGFRSTMDPEMHTVLLVDDDLRILDRLKHMIESIPGFKVVLATNGKEGLEKIQSEQIDCVILDYQMPVMNGLQFLHLKRESDAVKDIPVILCSTTNNDTEFWEVPLIKGWITAFLPKLCTEEDLNLLLEKICIKKIENEVWERTLTERRLI